MTEDRTEQKTVEETTKEQNTSSGGQKPTYRGDGVAVWVFKSKEGKEYLSIKIVGHDYIKAFPNES